MPDFSLKLPMTRVMRKGAAIDEPTLPNSVLNRRQSDRFLDLVRDYSKLLKAVRMVRVNHPKGNDVRLAA